MPSKNSRESTCLDQLRSVIITISTFVIACVGLNPSAFAAPPKIVSIAPANNATDVDSSITRLKVVFDQDMNTGGGYSVCGGGESFPKVIRNEWVDARTFVMHVKLRPDHTYQMALNCPASGRNFRSTNGDELAMVQWSFITAAKKDSEAKKDQAAENEAAYKELGRALRDHYSYLTYRDIDLKSVFKQRKQEIIESSTTATFARRVADMLAEAKDVHIWLTYDGTTIPSFVRSVTYNVDRTGLEKSLPNLEFKNNIVASARTDDGIGYLLITSLDRKQAEAIEAVQPILESFMDCKGIIIDLRANSGGDETLAMPIASWFVTGEKIYAKHTFRKKESESGFGDVFDRKIIGNKPPKKYDGPVVVLTGPGIMSSCEAFVLMLKQADRVTLVGDTTYGSSGNPQPHDLGNGVTVLLPSWKAMLPDGTIFEGKGIAPDVKVEAKPEDFRTGDPVLTKALEILRK